jgi:hypothetical protein
MSNKSRTSCSTAGCAYSTSFGLTTPLVGGKADKTVANDRASGGSGPRRSGKQHGARHISPHRGRQNLAYQAAVAEEKRKRAEPDGPAAQDMNDELPPPHQDGELCDDNQTRHAESQRRGAADQINDSAEIDRAKDHPERQHSHDPARREDQFAARQAGQAGAVRRLRTEIWVESTKHPIRPSPSPL